MTCFSEDLADLDAIPGKYTREDPGLERLALDTRETGQQRRRCYQIASKPCAVDSPLFDYVQLITQLKGKIRRR
jgi:hypothetical protein